LNRLLIDLSWSSSRLEGNTYSLLDTKELIEHGTAAPGKDAKETQMIFELLLTKAAAIRDPFEQSLFLMVQLPYLQPFVDVNERTSRLAANISLIKSNLVPLSFIDVPGSVYIDGLIGVYEHTRVELLDRIGRHLNLA
jgi:Fic family protein